MWRLVLIGISLLLFVVYNVVSICMFGVPPSLSDTYYFFEKKHKHLGTLFTGMMVLVAILLLAPMVSLTELVSGGYYTILAFAIPASIIFVGSAPAFNPLKQLEGKVHIISAACAGVFSILWIALAYPVMLWVIPYWFTLLLSVALYTRTYTKRLGRDYWLEMMGFGSVFTVLLTAAIALI